MNSPELIHELLTKSKTIAVVGLSDDPSKASYQVSRYMQASGYRILPVNPAVRSVLGEASYSSLSELPERPDIVNVFRLPKFIPAIVDEMIALRLPAIWVQLGLTHADAAAKAEAAGMDVVMNHCIMVEHQRLGAGMRG